VSPGWSGGLGRHPAPGDTLGRYHLHHVLGTGGMATVYRATDPHGAAVAVKVLNPARVLPEDVKRFTREFRALSCIDHPNVVHVYEAGVHDGYPWIALELVEGHDLDAELAAWKGREPADRWQRVSRILRGVLQGLAHIHELGLVHRDLKPSNILLTKDGEPKITDFGVVKTDNTHSTQLTMAGRLVGTVAFMAPELITDEGVDRRTDLYALGAVLYLMCTFQRPIEADSVAGYLARHLTEVPRPVGEIEPATPAILERVCARLLQKDRQFRYPSANAVLQALERPEDPELPPLRGRDEFQIVLTRRILSTQDGAGAVLGLVGPEGSGKTHLLRVLVEQAPALRTAFATCVRGGAPLLAQLERALPSDRARNGWDRLLHVAREPLLLAIDDLDCDPSAADELGPFVRRALALEARPLLVVFTATTVPEALRGFVDGDTTGVPCETVPLGPLDAKATLAVLRDRGVQAPVLQVLGRRLHHEFGGVPGGMIEQVTALVDRGWLRAEGDALRAARPLDDFRKGELPVPERTRDRVLGQLDDLEPGARDVCELLAVLGRPASAALLERGRGGATDTPRHVDHLVDLGLLVRQSAEEQEVVGWRDPGAARVVRAELAPDRRRALHAAIADALGAKKRRTHNAFEVASHLEAAGEHVQALPLYVQAARRVAREGRPVEVLDVCEAGERTAARCAHADPREVERQRLWLLVLKGEALIARRAWEQAVDPLERAGLLAEREGDRAALARVRAALGRVHYRSGRFAQAEPLLREALLHAEEGAPERSGALRALADIALRDGRVDEARRLWSEARALADVMASKDALARARRGLAHVAAIEGNLEDAATLLRQAEDLLLPDGDVWIRTSILARAAEIDCALGHTASALFRARTLVDLLRQHGLAERLPEAYALVAEILVQVGDTTEALDAAHQCVVYAKASTTTVPPFIRLRVARVFCDLQRPEQARQALPNLEELDASPVGDGIAPVLHDPAAQLAAVRARVHATDHPVRARDLATWALTRPAPRMVPMAARIAIDAARALIDLGQPQAARTAIKHGLKIIGPTHDGLRLELLLTMQTASPDPRIVEALGTVVRRMIPGLPPGTQDAFEGRPHVTEALRWRADTPDLGER
jgi:tetratricopeptide (TPR) repeat protein